MLLVSISLERHKDNLRVEINEMAVAELIGVIKLKPRGTGFTW